MYNGIEKAKALIGKKDAIILAIESSCDETAAAITCGNKVIASAIDSQIEMHRKFGGVVPEVASREHTLAATRVVDEALKQANLSLSDLDAIAVTYGAGLLGSLLVGVSTAKALAYALDLPLIKVNHIEGHICGVYGTHPELKPPFMAVVASGGHTLLYDVKGYTDYRIMGGTTDDAAGEAFDKVARLLGLPYPGGAAMDRLAAQGFANGRGEMFSFPSPAVPDDSFDYSFSGLKTAVINQMHTIRQKLGLSDNESLPEDIREGIAASFTRVVTEGICQKLRCAVRETGIRNLVLAGGVAANSHLRVAVSQTAEELSVRLTVPPLSLCGDNAVMIGAQAYFEALNGNFADSSLNAYASDENAAFV